MTQEAELPARNGRLKLLLPAVGLGMILYLARGVLAPFVVAAVLAYILSPLVDLAEERVRLPRLVIVVVLFAMILGSVGFGIWLLEGRLAREVRALGDAGPDLVESGFVRLIGTAAFSFFGQMVDAHALAEWTNRRLVEMMGNPTDAFHAAERALDAVLNLFLSLLALFYMLLHGRRFGPYLLRFMPAARRDEVERVGEEVHLVLGRYVRGQLILIGLMSVVTYMVLAFGFHLPFALPIAVMTGVLEVIPFVGPVVAGGIAATVALAHGGIGMMLSVIVAYFVLRQLEDQLVMPVIVGRAVHVHPLVTIFAVLVGATTAGALGALLAVPATAALRVLVDYLYPSARPGHQAAHAEDVEQRSAAPPELAEGSEPA